MKLKIMTHAFCDLSPVYIHFREKMHTHNFQIQWTSSLNILLSVASVIPGQYCLSALAQGGFSILIILTQSAFYVNLYRAVIGPSG